MSTLDIIILIYSYSFSWTLIHLIDHGMDKKYQLVACVIAVGITLVYMLFSTEGRFNGLNYGFLTLPVITVLAFNLGILLSFWINKRTLRATWRGAKYFYTEKKNLSDYLISFFIIIIQFGWPILIAILLGRW